MKPKLRELIWQINQRLNRIFKTSFFDELYWKYRLNFQGDWKQGDYKDSVDHPHREIIMKILTNSFPMEDISSILEIGCNTGPNLIKIKNCSSFIKLAGIDISKRAIKEAKKLLPEADLRVGTADKLPWPDKSFDCCLVDAVLMYVGSDKIQKVIEEMIRVARSMIIIVDFHNPESDFYRLGEIKGGHWARNYVRLFEIFGYKAKTIKITKEIWSSYSWEKYGYFIIVDLNG
jgi:ubiquinone/menaquinone biosynthesis C-methylase UbiE